MLCNIFASFSPGFVWLVPGFFVCLHYCRKDVRGGDPGEAPRSSYASVWAPVGVLVSGRISIGFFFISLGWIAKRSIPIYIYAQTKLSVCR